MSNKRNIILLSSIVGTHILVILILWICLRSSPPLELELEKVISVNITNMPTGALPALNQQERDKREEEIRKKEEAIERDKRAKEKAKQDADNKKKEEEIRKKEEKERDKREEEKQEVDKSKKDRDKLKKEEERKAEERRKAEAERKAEANRKAKLAAEARAQEAKRQGVLGQHALQGITNQMIREWQKLLFSAIQFNDPNDKALVTFVIRRDGKVLSWKVEQKAKNSALNSQVNSFIKIVTAPNYHFPAFPADYHKDVETLILPFRAELVE